MSERKKKAAEQNDQQHFDERGPVLEVGAFARAPYVDGGDDANHHDGDDGCAVRGKRDDFGEIAREGASQCRDRAAGDHQEQRPAIEERGNAAETVANEAVQAASFGIGGGELRVGERAKQRKNSADDPYEKGKANRTVELPQNEARREKNPRAYDRADEQEKQIALTQRADEWSH